MVAARIPEGGRLRVNDLTAPSGLRQTEVRRRRTGGLGNAIPDDTGRSVARILSANVFTLFNAIVGGSFVLLLLLGSWEDALFGFFVIANTVIGVVQELRAKRTLARLAVLSTPRVLVRRDGEQVESAVADVVLGDLLVLGPGEQLAADAVLVEGSEMEVDESLLTGKAEPVSVAVGRELLSGSFVVGGHGIARVVRVGSDSYAARITVEARRFSSVNSELRRGIARVIRWLSLALLPITVIVVNGQMQAVGGWSVAIADGTWREATVAAVASIIAMVPAGLVFMTSVALALGAVRLSREKVLVRELGAVEGLARVDILCLDKTGTLTEGTMTLDRVELVDPAALGWQSALAWLAADPVGNATARAIAAEFGTDRAEGIAPDAVVSFSSRHKWSAAHFAHGASPGSWVLGGADVILAQSSTSDRTRAHAAKLAEAGERTLLLARSPQPLPDRLEPHTPLLPAGLEPVTFVVLRERLRPDAAEIVRYFEQQGVQLCIMSGDDPQTVAAIAREVGLPVVLEGVDARSLPAAQVELAEILRTRRVFGRVTPEQKKALVLALQAMGHTVAMIGDGVNDTLALKHADLGIAMGSGSAAARAVAHVVLLDGAFTRLPGVVAEGRRVITNVERLAKLFLSKTVYAIILAVVFGVLLWPFPFLPRNLSVVDGLTIGLPALVLAVLPNTRRYLPGFLPRAARFCVPSGIIVAAAVIAIMVVATAGGTPPADTRTLAVITLTLSALWVLVILARPFTRVTAVVVAGGYAGLIAVLAIPASRQFLQLGSPSATLVLVAIGASVVASVLLELAHRRSKSSPGRRP
jgi:cation-transporting ATPase E